MFSNTTNGVAELRKVQPNTVHKEFEDDVLVYNDRGALPVRLSRALVEAAALGEADRAVIGEYYLPGIGAEGDGDVLFLRTVPRLLGADDIDGIAHTDAVLKSVKEHYAETQGRWILRSSFMDEAEQILLAKRFLHRSLHMTDGDRHKLSAVLDRVPGLSRPEVLYVNMHIDTRNYFFYRKHHEHVPGIMILEVIRQAMYAQFYRYSNHTRQQVSLTIENLNVDFCNFVNANYPVRIRVEDARTEEARAADESEQRVATFYQLEKVVAIATMRAKPIKMNLFKRLRKVKPEAASRFIPVKNIARHIAFLSEGGKKFEGVLNDLSLQGISATFEGEAAPAAGETLEFFMFVEGVGFISGKSEVRWSTPGEKYSRVGFKINAMSSAVADKWHETLKNFTFLNTRRDAF